MDKISVIVPVYNVEQYLSQCVESVLSQTHGNLEIFLVDDGSTDRSGAICDEYSKKSVLLKLSERNIQTQKESKGKERLKPQ